MDEKTLRTLEPGARVFCTLRAWSPEHLCKWCEEYVFLGATTSHGRLQAVVVGMSKTSAATGLADPYEQDGRDHALALVCVELWNVHVTKQEAADHSWELLVNQHKAIVRALGERCLPPCDPGGLHGFPVSAYCRATGDQRCHICEDADCGDNLTPSIVRLRQRPTVAACLQLSDAPSTPEAAAVVATAAKLFKQTVDQELCVIRDGASPGASEDVGAKSVETVFIGASDAVPEGASVAVPLAEMESDGEGGLEVGGDARHSYLCQCEACTHGEPHLSDCAVHNAPSAPNGPCDCRDEQAALMQPTSGPPLEERISEPMEPPLWKAGGGRSKAARKEEPAEERRAALLARLNVRSASEGSAP